MILSVEYTQERKSSLNIKLFGGIFRGRPGGYPGGHPDPKAFTPSLGACRKKVFCCAEVDHGP